MEKFKNIFLSKLSDTGNQTIVRVFQRINYGSICIPFLSYVFLFQQMQIPNRQSYLNKFICIAMLIQLV